MHCILSRAHARGLNIVNQALLSPDQANRLPAGAANWKIFCPPAYCVDCLTEPTQYYPLWGGGWESIR